MISRAIIAGLLVAVSSATALALGPIYPGREIGSKTPGFLGPPLSDALPAGAVGVWYADEYTTSPRPLVPNSLSAVPTTGVSLWPVSRRLFSNNFLWFKSGITAADSGLTGPDGLSDASLLTCTGDWYMGPTIAPVLAAGTYIMAVSARSQGADQTFVMKVLNGSLTSPVKTATTTWQRFTFTFTTAGGALSIRPLAANASASATLEVCDLELFAGSIDLHQPLSGAMVMGDAGVSSTIPSYTAPKLDFSSTGYGWIQLPAKFNTTNVTAIAVTEKVAAGSAYQAFFSDMRPSLYNTFTTFLERPAQRPNFLVNVNELVPAGATLGDGLWKFLGRGVHMITQRYDGATGDTFLDDVKIVTKSLVTTGPTIGAFYNFNVNGNGGFQTGHKMVALALYDRALTDAEVRSAYAFMQTRAATKSITMTAADRIIAFEGESLTAGNGTIPTYANLYGANASPTFYGSMFALSGSYVNTAGSPNMQERAAGLDAVIPPNKNGRKFILSVQISNDLLVTSSATYLSQLATYLDARKAAGWDKVVLATILPRIPATYATFNTRRAEANPILRTWVGTHCDAIIDFAAEADYGDDADASDAAKYYDGVHPTAATQIAMEAVARAVLDAL